MKKLSLFPTEVIEDFIDEEFRLELLRICDKHLEGRQDSRLIPDDPVVGRSTYESYLEVYDDIMNEPAIKLLYEKLKSTYVPALFEGRGELVSHNKTFLTSKYDEDDLFDPAKWHVFFTDMSKGCSLDKHWHTGNPLTGIIYLECDEDVPPLTLYEPRPWAQILEHYNGMKKEINLSAETGKLLLWDSFGLMHGVKEMTSDGSRKTLVFGL